MSLLWVRSKWRRAGLVVCVKPPLTLQSGLGGRRTQFPAIKGETHESVYRGGFGCGALFPGIRH